MMIILYTTVYLRRQYTNFYKIKKKKKKKRGENLYNYIYGVPRISGIVICTVSASMLTK